MQSNTKPKGRAPRGSTVPTGMQAPLTDKSTEARMQRSHDRDLDRVGRQITVPRRQQFAARMEEEGAKFRANQTSTSVKTPYGPVTLSKFPTSDPAPKVTTKKTDYGGSSVGHKYSELSSALFPKQKSAKRQRESDGAIAEELLSSMEKDMRPPAKKRKIEDGEQQNAAAKLMAIASVSEPERVGGTGKVFRGTLRAIKAQELTPFEAFESDNPTFSMAKTPDTHRRLMNREFVKQRKPPVKPPGFKDLGGHMSDSSDDEY